MEEKHVGNVFKLALMSDCSRWCARRFPFAQQTLRCSWKIRRRTWGVSRQGLLLFQQHPRSWRSRSWPYLRIRLCWPLHHVLSHSLAWHESGNNCPEQDEVQERTTCNEPWKPDS